MEKSSPLVTVNLQLGCVTSCFCPPVSSVPDVCSVTPSSTSSGERSVLSQAAAAAPAGASADISLPVITTCLS